MILKCVKCHKTVMLEDVSIVVHEGKKATNHHVHATTVDSEIQCVCGKYLGKDDKL